MRTTHKPISRPADDVLDRARFAHAIAARIDQLDVSEDGYVIALTGNWGSGKTSVVELILRQLRHLEMKRLSLEPLIGEREAISWNLSELEDASSIFSKAEPHLYSLELLDRETYKADRVNRKNDFARILGNIDYAEKANRYYELKFQAEQRPRIGVVRFSPWLIAGRAELATALLSDVAIVSGEQFGEKTKEAAAKLLERLADLAPLGAAGLTAAGGAGALISAGGTLASTVGKRLTKKQTLDDLMKRLRGHLKAVHNRRLLVVIDDIDRLLPREALEIVSLVKSLGDLPNVIYLLVYDDDRLAELLSLQLENKSLNLENKCNVARGYLEKIVQLNISIPPIAPQKMHDFFINEVVGILIKRLKKSEISDVQERLATAWNAAIQYYIESPRDITRISDEFRFASANLHGHIDGVDLLLLQILKCSDEKIYGWIWRNLASLTSSISAVSGKERLKKSLGATLADARQSDASKWIVSVLFPQLFSGWEVDDPAKRSISRSLHNPHYSSEYFELVPSEIGWSDDDIQFAIDEPARAIPAFFDRVKKASEQDGERLRILYLETLNHEIRKRRVFSEELLIQLIENIHYFYRCGDVQPGYLTGIDNEQRLRWILYTSLRVASQEERGKSYLNLVKKSSDVSLLSGVFRTLVADLHPDGSNSQDPLVTFGDNELEIRTELISKVEKLMADGRFWDQANPASLIWFLWGSNREDVVQRFLDKEMNDGVHISQILNLPLSTTYSSGGDYLKVGRGWDNLIDLDRLSKTAEELVVKTGDEELRQSATTFLEALARGRSERNRSD
jgi:Cdc6-like AAA superfamily ATPase